MAASRRLVLVDRTGSSRLLTEDRRAFYAPRFSPDGRRVAVTVFEEGARNVWIYDVEGGTASRLTFDGQSLYPIWTANGDRVVFTSSRRGSMELFWSAADGSGAPEPLLIRPRDQYSEDATNEARWLVFAESGSPLTGRDIWAMPLDGTRTPQPVVQTAHQERAPALSPDGRWLAYTSNESGRTEVYVRPFPDGEGTWQVSTDGGTEPLWSGDGDEMFYRRGPALVRVAVQTDPVFAVRAREVLLDGTYERNEFHTNYDIHPDGSHFVMVESAEASTQLVVVLNWFEELRRRGGAE